MSNCFMASVAAALLLAAIPTHATTWVEAKAKDPVSGRSIEVQEPASYGSYIYHWPGKEDQVFWPYTDDAWQRFNPKTGYGASEVNPASSLDYVRKALPLLERQLATAPQGYERIPLLYLLGEYHRRLGDAGLAGSFFEQARRVTFKDEEGVERTGSEYFNELMKEREAAKSPNF
jgi:hypothetical protein